MFRSLFIGFLILSALTSKGVDFQIKQNTVISADVLLDLYNAAVAYADKKAEFADAKNDGTLLCHTTETTFAIQKIIRSVRHESQIAWALPDSLDHCSNVQCKTSDRLADPSYRGEIYSFGSDTSPPLWVLAAVK